MKKTLLSLLLVFCLLVFVSPAMDIDADAATKYTDGYFEYTVDSGMATITGYTGTASIVNIPTFVGVYPVNAVGEKAFQGNATMQYVVFPATLTKIGDNAFSGCVQLKEVTLPPQLARLGQRAFENCASISKITIQSTALTIPYTSASWKMAQPFYRAGYATANGIEVVFEDGVTYVPTHLFQPNSGETYCPKITSVKLADSVTEIKIHAFAGQKYLKTVDFGNGVEVIGEKAFQNCTALTSVTFPATSLRKIDDRAFMGCKALPNITLPSSLTTIGRLAFEGCDGFTTVTLPRDLAYLGQSAFANCKNLVKIIVQSTALNNIPSTDSTAGRGQPFYNAGTSGTGISVVFEDGVTRVPDDMFNPYSGTGYAPKITSVTMADTVKTIGTKAFFKCVYLESVNMGNGVTTLGESCFEQCTALTKINISKQLQSMDKYVFYGDTGIKSFIFPQTLKAIGSESLYGCTGLSYVRFLGEVPSIGKNLFYGVTTNVFFPKNLNWQESHLQNYGGSITWRGFHVAKIASQTAAGYAKMNEKVTVKVNAQGEDLKYVWYFKNAGASAYKKSTFTGATYSTTLNSDTKGRLVYCIVTDKYGCKARSKTIPLRQQVSITTQPKSVTVKYGAKATVSVKAAGSGLKYAWYIKNAGASKYTKSSVKSATYSIKMDNKSQGRSVYCIVTDMYGKKARSSTVQLKMKATVLTQPKTAYAKSGAKAKVTVKADGDGLTYAWYVKSANGSSYSKSSAKTATYTATMDSKTKDRYVYCIVKDKYGNKVKTDVVRLRMAATVKTQPKSTAVVSGKTAKITVKAVGDGLKYTWYVKNKGASKFTKASTTSATYSVKMTSKVNGRQVYCVVKDKYGKTVKTSTATLKLKK